MTTERVTLHALFELTNRLSEPLTAQEVAAVVVDRARDAMRATSAMLWMIDTPAQAKLVRAAGFTPNALTRYARIPLEPWLPMGDAMLRREPLFFESRADFRERYEIAEKQVTGTAPYEELSYACLPLVVHGKAIGGVSLVFPGPRPFTDDDRTFLAVLAHHAAQALERARLHDEAVQTKRLLGSVLDTLPVGVLVSRPPDSELVFSNDALARIWGVDKIPTDSESRCKLFNTKYPDGRLVPREESPVLRALRGEVVSGMEARIDRADGSCGWILVSAAPVLRDDDGSVEIAVATFTDVTAEKEARAAAEDAGRAKDDFLAMLGHELRNPLTPIVSALDLARLSGDGIREHERAIIERQVKHVTRLVDDLLDVSRALRGGLRLERAPVEMWSIVSDAVEMSRPSLEERRHALEVSVPATGLVVFADRMRLSHVIGNLVNNAAKYTPAGGHVTVTARAEGTGVIVEVGDDGVGIDAELLPRVFDAFVQGPQGLERKSGGLGLGLAIAKHLVVAHGGTIDARSDGRGTTISIHLPSVRTELPVSVSSTPPPQPALERESVRRVLLVDDNLDALHVLAKVLRKMGNDVRTASDGARALEIAPTFAPDVVLLDIGLPLMDGYEVARLLRQIPTLATTALVAITGYAQERARERALASGFAEHLAKPVDLDHIVECLDRVAPRPNR
jgi:signal transduction histidine kinase/ActR/RegA family two-component response regulator